MISEEDLIARSQPYLSSSIEILKKFRELSAGMSTPWLTHTLCSRLFEGGEEAARRFRSILEISFSILGIAIVCTVVGAPTASWTPTG